MASSDVIELGSSDDEAEPVPKKKKPTLNAMVHFPNEVPGLVIKPVKPVLPNLQKVLAGGAVTITNVKKLKVPIQVHKAKPNSGRSVQKFVQRPPLKIPIIRNASLISPMAINNLSVNPLSLMKKQHVTKIQNSKLSLPPGITVTRKPANQVAVSSTLSTRRKQNFKRKQPAKIITTVELDDEEVPLMPGASPQWYLRPEEELNKPEEKTESKSEDKQNNDLEKNVNMELENNKEPDTRNYIEITIEDSPIKPLQIMKGFEVGSELPITIEDSPIKPIKSVKDQACVSDSEVEKSNIAEPQSKKRLDYQNLENNLEKTREHNIAEMDVEMVQNTSNNVEVEVDVHSASIDEADKTNKHNGNLKATTSRIGHTVKDQEKSDEPNIEKKSDSDEFHSIYQKFIDLCFELENSDDMTKIVEKKIKTYYRQCPKDFVESEEFTDMVSSKILAMKAAPDKMYLYIKDIVDELNLQRKTAKAVEALNTKNNKTEVNYSIVDDGDYDTKRRRQIRKLDKTIKKLHRAIQKLEEQEVEFEDEEDSVYLLTERYKERLIRVHAKFCQLTNTKMPSEPRIQIESRPGFPMGPARRLEKWVNKKVPIGTPLPFPDFHDVLQCVRDANEEDRLGWNEANIIEEARDLFTRCGKKLQRRRQENEWRIAAARISHDVSTADPAEKSDDLKKKLEENKILAAKREIELLNKYADKQNQLKLVGVEIGDKEAQESPEESEDDEVNDESNSLEDKEKRKERLKRLLQEKSRKNSTEKEIIMREAEDNTETNQVVSQEEKVENVQCNIVAEKTATEIEAYQEIPTETEINNTNTLSNIPKNEAVNERNKEKTIDSDINDVDSDIDELHLLQKLYSESEINSSTQQSDSDTPIAISDTLDSENDDDNAKIRQSDDIISIENSSYSDSEDNKDDCESSTVSEGVKNKIIDGLHPQSAKVLLASSISKHKFDLDEENILLASSEEENDLDHLYSDNVKDNVCAITSSNDSVINNNCKDFLDDSVIDEISIEKDIEIPYIVTEVPYIENKSERTNKCVIMNNTLNDELENHFEHIEIKEATDKHSNPQMQMIVEIDESQVSLVAIEENQGKLEKVKKKNNNVIGVFNDETICTDSEVVSENDNKGNCEPHDCYKSKETHREHKMLNDREIFGNGELNTTVNKKINSKSHDSLERKELCPKSNVDWSITDNTKSNSGLVFSDSKVMDFNVEITGSDSSLNNQQSTCVEVEVPPSVNAS